MANHLSFALAAGIITLSLAAAVLADPPPANPDTRLTTRPATELSLDELLDELPAALRLNLGRDNEYDRVIADLQAANLLSPQDEAGIRARLAIRNQMLRDWAGQTDKGRALLIKRLAIAQAARNKDNAEFERLRLDAKPLADEYVGVRNAGRVQILDGLSDAQLNFLVARSLRARVMQELPLRLSAEQAKAMDELCLRQVEKGWSRTSLKDDPFFLNLGTLTESTVSAARSEVATAEQNAALDRRAARHTQQATTRPAADEPAVPGVREPAP
jgi:hypothetical protein